MKKIIWTFLITLALVVLAALIGGYFYLRSNPAKLHQMVGCNTIDDQQAAFNQQLGAAINTLIDNQKVISQQIRQLQEPAQTIIQQATTPAVEPTPETPATDIDLPIEENTNDTDTES